MATFSYLTNHGDNPKNKPRVYFTCHPEDLAASLEKISGDIFKTHDCAIYYTQDMTDPITPEELDTDLGQMNLFVVPVTGRLLTQPSRAMSVDIAYAKGAGIPILPFMMEEGLDALYTLEEHFGLRQYLSPFSQDLTAIRYEEKLKKHLESVLISDQLAQRIRAAFDAYIFLSYRKKDRSYANALMKLIHKNPECRDIAIWYDEFLTPGESFADSIHKALKSSKLFALLVTPNLLEEPDGKPNYVMAEEYPAAYRAKLRIFPAEMEKTDRAALAKKFRHLPPCVDPRDEALFKDQLLQAVRRIAKTAGNDQPEHRFLVGLAYFEGIDMEVDRERGLQLITSAAEAGLPEAMERLIRIYTDGKTDPAQARFWSQQLADHYYTQIFPAEPCPMRRASVTAFFSHYEDEYWADTMRFFLLRADRQLEEDALRKLYDLLLSCGIWEYTLLFEIAKAMENHRETVQLLLVQRILQDAADGNCAPYGPLFWYIPEYDLYETALKAAQNLAGDPRAAALVRDVCFIFGQYDRAADITDTVDGNAIYRAALPGLSGVRRALCELFYTGATEYTQGSHIYPRCFNVEEARSLAETGMGMKGRRLTLFEDELGLFRVTESNDRLSGLVILPYDGQVEPFLAGNIRFVRGLILLDTDNRYLDYLEFFRKHIRVLYIPENCTDHAPNFALHMPLELSIRFEKAENHQYLRQAVRLPEPCRTLPAYCFDGCAGLQTLSFPEQFAPPETAWPDSDEDEPYLTVLKEGCFRNCTNLRGTVALPQNIQKIENSAFKNCCNLEEIRLPTALTAIGVDAFANCSALGGSLAFRQRLEAVDARAFLSCSGLTAVSFQNGVDIIDANAFEDCTALEQVTFAQGLISIGPYAFYGTGLRQLQFPKIAGYAVAAHLPQYVHDRFRLRFAQYAFAHCAELEEVQLPDDLQVIPGSCFEACRKLRSFNWPAQLRTVESYAFSACALTDLVIPSHVATIGSYAFSHNSALTSVVIENPAIKIGEAAFSNCKNLTQAVLPDSLRHRDLGLPQSCQVTWIASAPASQQQEIALPGLLCIPEAAYMENTAITRVTAPDAIRIDAYAFRGCTALEQITVSSRLTQLGEWAFAGCASLATAPFLPQLEQLGAAAFENCTMLREAVLHREIRCLEGWVFAGCRQLQTVSLPPRLESIGSGAFEKCENLSLSGSFPDVTEIEDNAFAECSAITALELPAIEAILDNAFWGCTRLAEITFGSNLRYLGASALRGCQSLQTLSLKQTQLTEIGENTFFGCQQLKSISLPDVVTAIGEGAFLDCAQLDTIAFSPDALQTLGTATFARCTSLQQLSIPKVQWLNAFVFCGCAALKEVTLSPALQQIGEAAFFDCAALEQICLGESLTQIGNKAFSGCSGLRSIRIPLSVTHIGDEAFFGCDALELVEISRNFQEDIPRIFGDIDPQILRYIDTAQATHQHKDVTAAPKQPVRSQPEPPAQEELLNAAAELCLNAGAASVSLLQRKLLIGYARAFQLMEELEQQGLVAPSTGSGPRKLLLTKDQWAARQQQ